MLKFGNKRMKINKNLKNKFILNNECKLNKTH